MTKSVYITILLAVSISLSCETEKEKVVETKTIEVESNPTDIKEAITVKKDFLANHEGEQYLQSISGFMGANTMVDYEIVDGKWEAFGSSISAGMREGFDIELSEDKLRKLSSMKIVVADDLSVALICDGKTYFTVPFMEESMTYLINNPPEYFIGSIPKNLENSSTFLSGYLYLYARDSIPETEIKPIDLADVWADAALLVCDSTTGAFELSLFYGDCCDNSTYLFK